jgi:hypothetical protein
LLTLLLCAADEKREQLCKAVKAICEKNSAAKAEELIESIAASKMGTLSPGASHDIFALLQDSRLHLGRILRLRLLHRVLAPASGPPSGAPVVSDEAVGERERERERGRGRGRKKRQK